MPRPRKYADMVVKSFSIEREVYARLRAVLASQGRSISEEVNDLLQKRLAEFEGSHEKPLQGFVDYEALKRQHIKLSEETIRLTKMLRAMGVYEELKDMAQRLGLDSNSLSNAEEIAAKLLKNWKGLKTNVHLFITPLETAKQKKAIERKLEEKRIQNAINAQTSSTENGFR
jgi:predicted CopG family antitoxin